MDRKYLVFTLFLAACSFSTEPNPSNNRPQAPQEEDSGSAGFTSMISDSGLPLVPDAGELSDAGTDPLPVPDAGEPVVQNDAGPSDAGSSDAGTDAGDPDAGGDAQVPDCSFGQTRCVGQTTQLCLDGTWVSRVTCGDDQMCVDGQCEDTPPDPVCTPGEQTCLDDKAAATCGNDGFWDGVVCPYTCSAGSCTGVCNPGDLDCSAPASPQTCNDQYEWEAGGTCAVCTPGGKDCQGDVPRTCDGSGQWVSGSACEFVCSAGSCTGSCDPGATQCSGDTPQTCDGSGDWVSGSECPFVCSGGACTGVCDPGAQRCSGDSAQTCNGSGQWVTDEVCPYVCTGNGTCTGVCEPGATDCQGDVPRTCNGSGQWDSSPACPFACSAGSCTGVCEPGDTQCSGDQIQTCNGSGQWGGATNCPAVAGADSYCSAGSCEWDCQLDYDDCDGNPDNGCEAHLNTDSNNCGSCGHSCCGGTCGDGTCEEVELAPQGAKAFDVDSENLYYIYAGGLHKQPRDSSPETTIATEPDNYSKLTDVATNGVDVAWGLQGRYNGGGDPTNRTLYVRSQPVNGGDVTTLYQCAVCSRYPANLAFDNTRVYWQLATNDGAWRSGASGGAPISYASGSSGIAYNVYTEEGFAQILNFTSDGTNLYAIKYTSDSTIHKTLPSFQADNHDEVFMDFPSMYNGARVWSPVSDGTYLYFAGYDPGDLSKLGVWRKNLSGGNLQQVMGDLYIDVLHIATDGTHVYFARDAREGSSSPPTPVYELHRVPVGSGPTEFVASLGGQLDRIRIANECVYWNDGTGIYAKAVNP
jgi:hypothetical protein